MKSSKRRRSVGPVTQRLTVHLQEDVAVRLRMLCVRENRSLSNAVELALSRLLRSRAKADSARSAES
jgi:polysaccharide pyruvyl transferase WcaK-like protein